MYGYGDRLNGGTLVVRMCCGRQYEKASGGNCCLADNFNLFPGNLGLLCSEAFGSNSYPPVPQLWKVLYYFSKSPYTDMLENSSGYSNADTFVSTSRKPNSRHSNEPNSQDLMVGTKCQNQTVILIGHESPDSK